eukprot:1965994-Lingulodinium_polyedra.AAC.1
MCREGRAQAKSGGYPLYPDGVVGSRPKRPKQTKRLGIPTDLGVLAGVVVDTDREDDIPTARV